MGGFCCPAPAILVRKRGAPFGDAQEWGASVARRPPSRAYLFLGSECNEIIVGTCGLAR